ncbi:ankyrin repeat protein [Reticulomyxa filosa]|uniref:Ankyrin repeat protein n=1 Tax=Reticulomyxa filosa TaxID=46433 RepID=X6NXP2_RETFI|nr:ankyrin repeat protein [Reticulomyxa filosa]|eukprot:ETO31080.1 ankyrin repeat protein [Reticulomyxa filosa]
MSVEQSFYSLKRENEEISPEERKKQDLFACMINGDLEKFEQILPTVDVNNTKVKPLRSILSMACQVDEPEFVTKVLRRGADPNLQDQINRTPLIECLLIATNQKQTKKKKGKVQMVNLLLLNTPSAKKNLQDNDGGTALFYACQKGELEIVKLLLSTDLNPSDAFYLIPCNVNQTNKEGKSPLFAAVENGHKEVIEYLLRHTNCDVECATKSGMTVIMRACTKGSSEIVDLLLAHVPRPDINRTQVCLFFFIDFFFFCFIRSFQKKKKKPETKKTCIMMAAHKKFDNICKLLLAHECHLWLLDSTEKNVLDHARNKINTEIIEQMKNSLHTMIIKTVASLNNKSIPIDVIDIIATWTY